MGLHVGEEVWDFQDGMSAACALCSLIGRSFDLTIAFGVNTVGIICFYTLAFIYFYFFFSFFDGGPFLLHRLHSE